MCLPGLYFTSSFQHLTLYVIYKKLTVLRPRPAHHQLYLEPHKFNSRCMKNNVDLYCRFSRREKNGSQKALSSAEQNMFSASPVSTARDPHLDCAGTTLSLLCTPSPVASTLPCLSSSSTMSPMHGLPANTTLCKVLPRCTL